MDGTAPPQNPPPIASSPPPEAVRRGLSWRARLLLGMLLVALPPASFEAAARLLSYPDGERPLPSSSVAVHDRDGHRLAAFTSAEGRWCLPCRPEDHGRWLPLAVEAIEDERFRRHGGVDWMAAAGALWQDLRAARIVRGASTITMQLQRLRHPHARTLWGKLGEALRARQIELRQDKDAILAEWLERASFGGNVVGAGAAAWHWFGVPPAALSLAQAALLAGLPQNPERLRPDRHLLQATARRDQVLGRLQLLGVIDARELSAALAEPVALAADEAVAPDCIGVLPVLSDLTHGRSGVLTTTLDIAIQRTASALVRTHLGMLAGSGADAAAAAVLDLEDGSWRALACAGGPSWLDLTSCRRSPGSTLKPFIYAGAFAFGIATPATLVADDPTGWSGWAPLDYDHAWRGRCSAAEALCESRNLPAMHLLEQLGVARCAGIMEALCLGGMATAAGHAGLALAIGGAEADLRSLATAYGGLGAGGRRLRPLLLGAGAAVSGDAALPERACWAALHCLDDAERTRAACPEAAALRPAWKTGTSSGHRDAWCVALTPRRCVAVWLGSTRGPGSPALVGAEAAAPLALALIAACDPGGPSWPAVDGGSPSPLRSPLLPATLVITSPPAGAEIISDPDAAPGRGRIALECRGGGTGPRWWLIDGTPLPAAAAGATAWWTPISGSHELRVVDQAGHAAAVQLVVR